MSRRAVAVMSLAALALLSSGCGTFVNQQEPGMYFARQGRTPRHPFGGVGGDVQVGQETIEKYAAEPRPRYGPLTFGDVVATCALLAVDLPLSAVADTLFLPLDVAYTMRHQDRDVWAEWKEDLRRRTGLAAKTDDGGKPFRPIEGGINGTADSPDSPPG